MAGVAAAGALHELAPAGFPSLANRVAGAQVLGWWDQAVAGVVPAQLGADCAWCCESAADGLSDRTCRCASAMGSTGVDLRARCGGVG